MSDDASEIEILVDADFSRDDAYETVNSKEPFLIKDQKSQIIKGTASSAQATVEPPKEMFLPGCIVHIIRESKRILPFWRSWKVNDRDHTYKAFVVKRESFIDIKVTSHMFIDHVPWR